MGELNIKSREVGRVSILDLSGKVTNGDGNVQLRAAVSKLLGDCRNQILLNMAKVSHMDSAGIGELVNSYTTATSRGGQLKLVNLPRQVLEVLTVTQLLSLFQTFDTESKAVASFK